MKHRSGDLGRPAFDSEIASNLHLDCIERHWEIVAALAWKGYLAHRRGALLCTRSADPGGEWECLYLPLDSIEGHPLMQEYSKLLRSYDPTKQIVAVFLTPPVHVSAYCGGLDPHRAGTPLIGKKSRAPRRMLNF